MISGKAIVFAAEEMVETNFIQTCGTGECGEVPANSV
jgi:hypothetical protein